MASNTGTAQGRARLTYLEDKATISKLEKLAAESGLTVSALLRQAALEYGASRMDKAAPIITRGRKK